MIGSENLSNIPNLPEVLADTLKKVQEKTKTSLDPKNAELVKNDIEFQLQKLREIEKAGPENWRIVHEVAREVSVETKIPKEIIFSWIYGPEIDALIGEIFVIAEKHGKKQIFDLFTDRSLYNSKDAHDVAQKINRIQFRLGHNWSNVNGIYGRVGEKGHEDQDGSLAAGVRELQRTLNMLDEEIDGMEGTAVLGKVRDLLNGQEIVKKEITAEEKAEFDRLMGRRNAAIAELKELVSGNFTVEEIGIDLTQLDQYAGHVIKKTNPDGSSGKEEYDPNRILDAKDNTYFAPFGSSNEIWEAETNILEEAVNIYEKFRELDEQEFPDKLQNGVDIYMNLPPEASTAQKIAEKFVIQMIPEAFDEIDIALSLQERLQAATGLWEIIPAGNETLNQITEQKLGEIATEALEAKNHDKIHWEEVIYFLPEDIEPVIEAIEGAKHVDPNSLPSKREEIWKGPLENEIVYILETVDRKKPATDQLSEIIQISRRSVIKDEAWRAVVNFLNRESSVKLVKKAFKEIRASEGNALEKLKSLKNLYEELPATENQTLVAFRDLYDGKGAIDRELYGERGLVGRAFAEMAQRTDPEKIVIAKEILETLPVSSVAYAQAYERFMKIPGSNAEAEIQAPSVGISGTGLVRDVWRELRQSTGEELKELKRKIKTGITKLIPSSRLGASQESEKEMDARERQFQEVFRNIRNVSEDYLRYTEEKELSPSESDTENQELHRQEQRLALLEKVSAIKESMQNLSATDQEKIFNFPILQGETVRSLLLKITVLSR